MIRDIESKIRAVRRRLRMLRFYRGAVWGASIATAIAALIFLIDKLHPLPFAANEKWMAWVILLAAGVLTAAVYALVSRLTLFEAALAGDLRLGLQERFSSSILLRDRADDPAIGALISDTHHFCTKLHPRDDFPFLLPRRSVHHVWPFVGLFLIHFLMPQVDLFASAAADSKPEEVVMPKEERQEQAEKIEKMAKKIKENSEGEENEDVLKFAKDLEKIAQDLKTGEKNPKLALAEMSRVSEEVRVERNELARKFEGFQNLNTPLAAQNTRDLQQALQRNEFEKAAELARALAEKAQAESTASEKEQLASELQSMADQLAKDQPDMSQALEQAAEAMQKASEAQSKGDESGMNDALAQAQQQMQQSASAMNDQAQNAQLMQQLDQLQQSMEAQKRDMCRSIGLESPIGLAQSPGAQPGEASGESGQQNPQGGGELASQSSSEGNQGGEGSPGDQPGSRPGGTRPGSGNQPGSGAMAASQGGSEFGGQGQGNRQGSGNMTGAWQPGQSEMTGPGMGGPGRGSGGTAPFDDSNKPGFIDTKPPGEKNPGEIIAVMNVDAPALKGESKIEYQQVFTEYRQKADDAMSREDIPASLQPMVRDYFDAISPEVFDTPAGQTQTQQQTQGRQ